jgi:hypothetical protein
MTYRVTVDRAMERGVAMGRFCVHCGCEFATETGAKASCTTCNNERQEAGLPAHSNVRPREDELNVAAIINAARKRKAKRANGNS